MATSQYPKSRPAAHRAALRVSVSSRNTVGGTSTHGPRAIRSLRSPFRRSNVAATLAGLLSCDRATSFGDGRPDALEAPLRRSEECRARRSWSCREAGSQHDWRRQETLLARDPPSLSLALSLPLHGSLFPEIPGPRALFQTLAEGYTIPPHGTPLDDLGQNQPPLAVKTSLSPSTAPILKIPIEIMTEIFHHFLPATYPSAPPLLGPGADAPDRPGPDEDSPTLLSQVCRHCRSIAHATPTLWRAIAIFDSCNEQGDPIEEPDKLLLRVSSPCVDGSSCLSRAYSPSVSERQTRDILYELKR
uniref:F-box domain-containing protein n=1 Tax=Mycena chlorophos TaxID=658473 RepID=A0ABQ0LAE5_MYCCL|nr:predicted protein [Mycena chlorophos]